MQIFYDPYFPSSLYSDEDIDLAVQELVHQIQVKHEPNDSSDLNKAPNGSKAPNGRIVIRQQILLFNLLKELIKRKINIEVFIDKYPLTPERAIKSLSLISLK